jgi:uncharacterized protein YbaP (TraB family)
MKHKTKELHKSWTEANALFTDAMIYHRNNIKEMKTRFVAAAKIEEAETASDQLYDFYTATEAIISAQRILIHKMEGHNRVMRIMLDSMAQRDPEAAMKWINELEERHVRTYNV